MRAKAPPTLRLAVGTPVGMIFDPNRTHVFDAETEQAIF